MYYKSCIKAKNSRNLDLRTIGEYDLHQEIWSLCPGVKRGESRFIYWVTPTCIYMISDVQPLDTTGRWLITSTVPYDPQLVAGQGLDFLYRGNPVYDVMEGSKKKRYSIIVDKVHKLRTQGLPLSDWPSAEEIRRSAVQEWFDNQGKIRGFKVSSFSIDQQRDVQFENGRSGDIMKFTVLDIRGNLTVTDPVAFKQVLLKGLGKAKRFGYGMFMVKGV